MSAELATPSQNAITTGATGLSIFDTGTFEQMGMIASKLADSPILPESLRGLRKGQNFTPFEPAQVASNCFRLVEQASRWQVSPFAIMDCASVIHGKLMWEGKVIASAISSLLKVRLNYDYSGEGVERKVIVSGKFPDEDSPRSIEGTVKDWKTDQWKSSAYDQRLAYRGAREWARRHAPEVILGVYSPDEINESDMRNVTPKAEIPDSAASGKVAPFSKKEEEPKKEAPAQSTPQETPPAEKSEPPLRRAYIVDIDKKEGEKDGKPWTRYRVTLSFGDEAIVATTFSTRLGDLAMSQHEQWVLAHTEEETRGVKLVDLKVEQEGLI